MRQIFQGLYICLLTFMSVSVGTAVEITPCTFIQVTDGQTLTIEIEGKQEQVRLLYVDIHAEDPQTNSHAKLLLSTYFRIGAKPENVKIWSPGTALQRDSDGNIRGLVSVGREQTARLMEGDKVIEEKQMFTWNSLAEMLVSNGLSAFMHKDHAIPAHIRNKFVKAQENAIKNASGLWSTHPEWIQEKVTSQGELDTSSQEVLITEDLSILGEDLRADYTRFLEERQALIVKSMESLQKPFKKYKSDLERVAQTLDSEELRMYVTRLIQQEERCLSVDRFANQEELIYFDDDILGFSAKSRLAYVKSKTKEINRTNEKLAGLNEKMIKKMEKEIKQRTRKDPVHAKGLTKFLARMQTQLPNSSDIIGHPNLIKTHAEVFGTMIIHSCVFTKDDDHADVTELFIDYMRNGKIDGMLFSAIAARQPDIKDIPPKKTYDRIRIYFQYGDGVDDEMDLEFLFEHFDRFYSSEQLLLIMKQLIALSKKDPEYEGCYEVHTVMKHLKF